jgi:hypothetical protein
MTIMIEMLLLLLLLLLFVITFCRVFTTVYLKQIMSPCFVVTTYVTCNVIYQLNILFFYISAFRSEQCQIWLFFIVP